MLKVIGELNDTKRLTLTALFCALGVIIPYATAHGLGLEGRMFLPMHLPVLLCGLICGPRYGFACGVISPLMSSLYTGMPLVYPMLPIMLLELSIYGFVSGILFNRLNLPIYFALPLTLLAGRAGYAIMYYILFAFNPALQALTVWAAVVTGLPGIAIQLVAIPAMLHGKREG